ncbi:hypothetical protein B0T26DRAFT_743596 [Lasiosphaeria miniovina]|uniref:DUF8021 domain-containing protein n=1 Tax=Lasiosphaeria miniovina TaxID=1954250 RepID=A0AA40DNE8_9PEZI|nr:uncharacterized protein B0T26DRAFT_743596 [Lasiosphaeria miniovina]KAK0706248.1 hypothetical protein B0T26DRAFT_743596 [Lasiosphaeria miniovina]
MYALIYLLAAAPAWASAAACERSTLVETASRYIAAQSAGQIQYLTSLGANATYTENAVATNITSGILGTPLKIDHTRSIYDTAACAAYTELIVTDPKHPYVIGTQLRLSNNRIARVESVVTDAGDWLFNAQHTLHYALLEDWSPIDASKRDSRAVIQAAGDAYLDLFRNGTGSVAVPWADNCRRLEGGLYTAPGDTCNSGVPSGVDLADRRYVIDETLGVVDVFLRFGGPNGQPDSHEFRVEGGKIRYVHTITACAQENCGLGLPPAILGQDVGW